MDRLPWAPLNAGVFLIILASLMLLSFFSVGGLNVLTAIPLIFAFFGVWLVIAGLVLPPSNNPYGAPRIMILGWGALIMALGFLWYVGVTAFSLLPFVFVILLLVAGIGAVGYSFVKAGSKKPPSAVV